MADITLSGQFQTITAPTASTQKVITRDRWAKVKNVGANFVQIANITDNSANTPGTSIAVGNRTSLAPAPASGIRDEVLLKPFTAYLIQAASADTLVTVEEIGSPMPTNSGA